MEVVGGRSSGPSQCRLPIPKWENDSESRIGRLLAAVLVIGIIVCLAVVVLFRGEHGIGRITVKAVHSVDLPRAGNTRSMLNRLQRF